MRGQRSSGGGSANGCIIGPEGGFRLDRGLQFDAPVPSGGYRWWYIDALSDDQQFGLTIIIFVGSVFSPYYKWQRRNGQAVAEDHCAFNVVLFGKGGKRWSMTERGADALSRNADQIEIGPSRAQFTGNGLHLDIDEICVPFPFRVRGTIDVTFDALNDIAFHIDSENHHVWRPIAPCSSIRVSLSSPNQHWQGRAYVDSNWGSEPVEARFKGWQWSRAEHGDKACVYYDTQEKDGRGRSIACAFHRSGALSDLPDASLHMASRTGWQMRRPYRSEAGAHGLIQTVEDTPFYARSLMAQTIHGEKVTAIHESLSVDRFASPIVQAMLPWRMPRRASFPR